MNSPLLFKKTVNAFIPDASPSENMELLPFSGAAVNEVLRLKKKWGGLWVGGTVEISGGLLSFHPNRLNTFFHEDLQSVEIPAAHIKSIDREFAWFTGIVQVHHQGGQFRFRCYGAKTVAKTLSSILGLA